MATFIQKNKKKGALAALLLFIRTRKTVSALLLLVVLASILFVSPSNLLLSFPGGARVAAGVAWIAGKVGMDTSRWGLAGGNRDYGDLVAAFRAAKSGGGKAGWSSFMRGGEAAAGAGGGSLDFVQGNRKDLDVKTGSGDKLPKAGTVQGVLNPNDAKDRGEGEGVALNEEDLGGERAGLVKTAFGSGVTSGFSGGSNVTASVGGGAYAGAGFFSGAGSAAGSTLGDKVKVGLDGLPKPNVPREKGVEGGSHGRLSGAMTAAVQKSISRGMISQTGGCIGQKCAFSQLATGNGRAVLASADNCNDAGGCPPEFAATNIGVVYDGGRVAGDTTGLLTGNNEATPVVPLDTEIPANFDPAKMKECADKVQACEKVKEPYYKRMGEIQTLLNGWYGQMGNACGDPCSCGGCNNLKGNINGMCNGELNTVINVVNAPCALPAYCKDMGVEPASTGEANLGTKQMCNMQMGSCGCTNWFCDICCVIPGC